MPHEKAGYRPPADRLTRFSDRAETYAQFRPSYPPEIIDAALPGLGPAGRLVVVDVGAGTGISSRLLADRGCRVIAVEPNDEMRRAGQSVPHPRIEWRAGTGEATGLPDACADLIACFQAFHWMEHERALVEFRRVLRPAGRLALVWNVQDETDPCTAEYRRIILARSREPPTSPSFTDDRHVPASLRNRWPNYRTREVSNEQSLDLPGLIGRAASASYCPNAGPARADLEADLRLMFQRFARDERIVLKYRCVAHLADRPA